MPCRARTGVELQRACKLLSLLNSWNTMLLSGCLDSKWLLLYSHVMASQQHKFAWNDNSIQHR